jgi:hypothetical protein
MNKEIVDLEKQIDKLEDIKEWDKKTNKMKELKEQIQIQKNKIEKLLETVNSGEVKKPKKEKELTFDELLKKFETSEDIDERIKIFNQIQLYIKDTELELFG